MGWMKVLSPAHSAFGAEVRNCRHSRGLTQEDLSAKLGLHVSHVSQVERGIKNVSLTNILKFSRALGCPVSQLMVRAEEAGL